MKMERVGKEGWREGEEEGREGKGMIVGSGGEIE